MMVAVCLECDEHIELDDETDVDDIVICPACNSRFEVIDLDPVMIDHATQRAKQD
jgi:lysine biosynthesis protein LysW